MACCRPTGLQSLALLALGEDVHRHGAQEHKTLDRLHHCGVDAHDRQALVDDAHDQCADNGAGKSTLVHVLAGLEQPDAGSIAVGGETVRLDGVAKAIDLGIAPAFQQPQFCENLDVSANIFLGREMRQGFASRDDEGMYNKAREVLNTLSTSVRAGQSIASLSGGQRQTIAIARTLLNDPSLIVLDEPTASLSVTQTAEVLDYIVRLRSDDRSVIMVCHDLPNVFAVADRIVVMRLGEFAPCTTRRRPPTKRTSRRSPAWADPVRRRLGRANGRRVRACRLPASRIRARLAVGIAMEPWHERAVMWFPSALPKLQRVSGCVQFA